MKTVLACGTVFGARRDQHQTIHNYITSLAINGGEILGEIGKIVIQTPAHFIPNGQCFAAASSSSRSQRGSH